MPQIITCPDCGRKLKVPDNLVGKRVKCPGCGEKFVGETEDSTEESPAPPSSAVASRSSDAPRSRRRDDDEDEDRPKSRRRVDDDEDEDEDYPVRKRRRDSDDEDRPQPSKREIVTGWERVRFGLNMVIIAIWIAVGIGVTAVLGYLLLFLFGAASIGSMMGSGYSGNGPPTQQQASQMAGQAAGTMTGMMVGGCLMIGILGLLALANVACRLTGLGFCMGIASTAKTQTLRVLAIAAFSIACANLVLPFASAGGGTLLARNGGGCLIFAGDGLLVVLSVAEIVCFLLFLRGVAAVMKKHDLAKNIVFYMVAVLVFLVMAPVLWFVMVIVLGAAMFSSFVASNPHNASAAAGNMAGTGAAALVGGLTCVGVIALIGLALLVWYIVLLYQVRSAVDGWLDRS